LVALYQSMKTLTLVSTGFSRPDRDQLSKLEMTDRWPRTLLYEETLRSEILDERFLERVPRFRKFLYKPLPIVFRQVIEAYVRRHEYDAIISWSEPLGLLFALLLKCTFTRVPHVGLFSWISKPKKARLLRLVHTHIDRIVLWSSYQRDFAVDRVGVPPEKITFLRWGVDTRFFRPLNSTEDVICSVGYEMRDYPTLIEALKGLEITCHIAAGTARFVAGGESVGKETNELPQNIVVGKKSYMELRSLYARSRFVVIPLDPASDTDNGVTAILESMSMGKAVICSKIKAQVDVIEHNKTGIYVPPRDPEAMRAAILSLWNHPEVAQKIGREGRAFVETHHGLEQFHEGIRSAVIEAIELRKE
jgi:glycosyltransferase involved in cell wall biosynthesis